VQKDNINNKPNC